MKIKCSKCNNYHYNDEATAYTYCTCPIEASVTEEIKLLNQINTRVMENTAAYQLMYNTICAKLEEIVNKQMEEDE